MSSSDISLSKTLDQRHSLSEFFKIRFIFSDDFPFLNSLIISIDRSNVIIFTFIIKFFGVNFLELNSFDRFQSFIPIFFMLPDLFKLFGSIFNKFQIWR